MRSAFSKQLVSSFKNLSSIDASNILDALSTLLMISERKGILCGDVIDDFAKSINENEKIDFKIEPNLIDKFKKRLLELLGNEKVFNSVKSSELYAGHEKLFSSVQIFTDIRPVYINSDELPKTAIISTTLRLNYFDGESNKVIYIAIDEKDIKSIKKAIEFAENQINCFSNMLDKMNVKKIKIEGEE
jgi:hypothetical protein